jgi:hypothetical protein
MTVSRIEPMKVFSFASSSEVPDMSNVSIGPDKDQLDTSEYKDDGSDNDPDDNPDDNPEEFMYHEARRGVPSIQDSPSTSYISRRVSSFENGLSCCELDLTCV